MVRDQEKEIGATYDFGSAVFHWLGYGLRASTHATILGVRRISAIANFKLLVYWSR
jgi:hypothetical protein